MARCMLCHYFSEVVYINGEKMIDHCHYHNKQIQCDYAENNCDDFIHYDVVEKSLLEEWEK